MKNNKDNQEIKFQVETELLEINKQNNPKKTIKLAEKNLKRVFLDVLSGKNGEC